MTGQSFDAQIIRSLGEALPSTEEMAAIPERVRTLGPGAGASNEEVAQWIEETFSLRYPGFSA